MDFREGASVYTTDGKEAGRLHRVVIDPETNEVTHVVVQRGFLNKEDKVVAIGKVASTSQDGVFLQCSAEELNEMPPLEITQYVQASSPPRGDTYLSTAPVYSMNQPSERHKMVEEIRRTLPGELVALKEGAPVLSADGEQIGHIEHVITHPETGQVTQFIVSQGLLLKARKLVPIHWVDVLADDKVFLDVGTQQIRDLPPWQD